MSSGRRSLTGKDPSLLRTPKINGGKKRKQSKNPKLVRCSSNSNSKIVNKSKEGDGKGQGINKGDVVDYKELLFNPHRDYLVRRDGHQVRVDDLKGKTLVIYMMDFFCDPRKNMLVYDLIQAYDHLLGTGAFEVVLVVMRDDYDRRPTPFSNNLLERFRDILSLMPWPAIPYFDLQARRHVEHRLAGSGRYLPTSIILDPRGKVLELGCGVECLFYAYGAEGFPFTSNRIQDIKCQDEEALEKPSLNTLLASPSRDFVISNEGKKVPISGLQDKVVGLYFYEADLRNTCTNKLKTLYEELKGRGVDFEIVLIHLDFTYGASHGTTEESFWKYFGRMPWLALPFKDPYCRKLLRIFKKPDIFGRAILPIIGPKGSYIEFFGADIILRYGIRAYPFTREKAAEIEMRELQKLMLNPLLDSNTALRRGDGSQVHVPKLSGKNVLLLFADDFSFKSSKFLTMLAAQYHSKKDSDEEFEVVCIPLSDEDPLNIPDMPWLLHPFCENLVYSGSRIFKGVDSPVSVAAFCPDGKFLAKKSCVADEQGWQNAFPFFTGDLKQETLKDLVVGYDWDFFDDPYRHIDPLLYNYTTDYLLTY